MKLNSKKWIALSVCALSSVNLVGTRQINAQNILVENTETVLQTDVMTVSEETSNYEYVTQETQTDTLVENTMEQNNSQEIVSEEIELEISQTSELVTEASEKAVIEETSEVITQSKLQLMALAIEETTTEIVAIPYTGYNKYDVVNFRDSELKGFAGKLTLGAKVEGFIEGLWISFAKDGQSYKIARTLLSDTPINFIGYSQYAGAHYRDVEAKALIGVLEYGQKVEGIIEEGWINTTINGVAAKVSKSLLSTSQTLEPYTGYAKFNVNYRDSQAVDFIGQLVKGEKVSGTLEGEWVNFIRKGISSKVAKSCLEEALTGINQNVQNLLNKYAGSSIYVYFESETGGDKRTAGIRGESTLSGQSMPKVAFAAYAQDLVERGVLKWDQKYQYVSAVSQHPLAYPAFSNGTIQQGGIGRYYTLKQLVELTMSQSDNVGADMLMYYVCYPRVSDFNNFTYKVYGASSWSWNISPHQATKMMKYVKNQREQVAWNSLNMTWWDQEYADVVPANVFQKVGMYEPVYNHITAYTEGNRPYFVTIMTRYWSRAQISSLAKQIYNATIQ